ncbi:MAG: DNA-binding protein [Elusimicrobiota bacterium]|jgi:predicted DNA-binding protein with PD1-like motif|nr:DNA-binding protein [Elusimicrobiota bacterium]
MQIAIGSLTKTAAFRLGPGEDILEGLKEACEKTGINNGMILGGIGSLDGARFFDPVELPHKKAGYGYSEPVILTGPIELTSLSGMICQGVDGETLFHVHFNLSDGKGNAFGGHLIEGNKVLLTADIIIAEIAGIKMGRRYDENLEVFLFNPTDAK